MLSLAILLTLSGAPPMSRRSILRSTIIVEGLIALLPCVIYAFTLVYDWVTEQPSWPAPWAQLSWSWTAFGWGCLAALPPLVLIWLIDLFPVGPLRKVK